MKNVDFFALKGYRLMAAQVLCRAIKDVHSNDSTARGWAIDWFNYEVDLSKPDKGVGLRFQDCLDALGNSSRTKEFRELVFNDHEKVIRVLDLMSQRLSDTRVDIYTMAKNDISVVSMRPGGLFSTFPSGSTTTSDLLQQEFETDRSAV